MSATIVPFRRDLKKLLVELTTFDPKITVQQMHERHEQIRLARQEAYAQRDAGLIKTQEIWPFTHAMDEIHNIALRAGVPMHTLEVFNKDRWDWKDWKDFSKKWARLKPD